MPMPQMQLRNGATVFAEVQEFGTFGYETQRYICRALYVAFTPDVWAVELARDVEEADNVRTQRRVYKMLPQIRSALPTGETLIDADSFLYPLIGVTAYDISSGCIGDFSHYRFLYERLLGAAVRPWLPSAFAAAVALPYLLPEDRRMLLASLEAAVSADWSQSEPAFYPEWIEG